MTQTTNYPFEIPYREVKADVDVYINTIFDSLHRPFWSCRAVRALSPIQSLSRRTKC